MIINDFYQTRIEPFNYNDFKNNNKYNHCYTLSDGVGRGELLVKVKLIDFNKQPVRNREVELECNMGYFENYDEVHKKTYTLKEDNKIITGNTGSDGAIYVHYKMSEGERGFVTFSANEVVIQVDNLNPYPIGSIYMSMNNINPAQLFGGTWEQIQGRFLLGEGTTSGTSTKYTALGTGGSATHALTSKQMPRHNHGQNAHNHKAGDNRFVVVASGVNLGLTGKRSMTYTKGSYTYLYGNKDVGVGEWATTSNATATNKYAGGSGTGESASNGDAHNNMPPYIVVYIWQRTG